jgi:two-component system response regulator YesN
MRGRRKGMIEVLLVDDEAYVVESLQQTIPWKEMGVQHVHIASSVNDALQVLEEQPIDIVVTDIRMPGMSGLEFIERINQKWKHIKCILLTGYADFEYAKKAIQLHAFDYLLKPVDDEEFINTISNAVDAIRSEWEERKDAVVSSKAHLLEMGNRFMHDLFLGKQLLGKWLLKKISDYHIPIQYHDDCAMLLFKIEPKLSDSDDSISTIEKEMRTIIQEAFADQFHFWYGKSPHHYFVVIVAWKTNAYTSVEENESMEQKRKKSLEQATVMLQQRMTRIWKENITIFVTDWFCFPDKLPSAYRKALTAFFQGRESDKGEIIFLEERPYRPLHIKSIESLYKPPTLIHLLESNQWDAAESKINDIFKELQCTSLSHEHIYEVFLAISNAFVFLAHKQGCFLSDIDNRVIDVVIGRQSFYTIDTLREWTFEMFQKLKQKLQVSEKHAKKSIIKQVQEIVMEHLSENISVKTIAEKVYLHPVYLSKLYKSETGESLGDYIIRIKMERAAFLLKHSNLKIYEITSELGYQNPQYFSRIFKKVYGMTPQEFRDKSL